MKTAKKILFIIVLNLTFFLIAKAQWVEVNNLTTSISKEINFVNKNRLWLTSSSGNTSAIVLEYDSMFNSLREINLLTYGVINVQSIYTSNSDTAFLKVTYKYGAVSRTGLLATYDGGSTFTKDFFFNTIDFTASGVNVSFFNSLVGYFVKDTVGTDCKLTYQTYDAGKTWERRSDCGYLNYKYKTGKFGAEVFESQNYRVNGCGLNIFFNKTYDTNYIAYTNNYGNTWHDRFLGQTKFSRITGRNAERFICHERKSPFIAYTTDSGNTFQGFQRNELINNIRFCENTNGQSFYIMTTENGTFINYNEDNNWIKIDKENFVFAKFNNSTNGFAAKDIDGINYQINTYSSDENG